MCIDEKKANDRRNMIEGSLIWATVFSVSASLLLFAQWLSWNGPVWVRSSEDGGLGFAVLLSFPFAIGATIAAGVAITTWRCE